MRAPTAGFVAASVVALGFAVALVGRTVIPVSAPGSQGIGATGNTSAPPISAESGQPEAGAAATGQPGRPVAIGVIAQPPVEPGGLIRAAPRDPLGPLGQALPPQAKPGDWDGTILYRPVATQSAEFEAMGYRLAIAGTQSIDASQTCNTDGVEWACGIRARTAVRLWLRGRALSCELPPAADPAHTVAGCRLGKLDVGTWLVSNGWARAVAGGPYAEAEAKARKARLGIFGPPPVVAD